MQNRLDRLVKLFGASSNFNRIFFVRIAKRDPLDGMGRAPDPIDIQVGKLQDDVRRAGFIDVQLCIAQAAQVRSNLLGLDEKLGVI